MDIKITHSKGTKFNIRVAGLVISKGRVLFQRKKGDLKWALPGGSAVLGESLEKSLKREFHEEIGASLHEVKLLASTEDIFIINEVATHQIGFYFLCQIDKEEITPLEKDLEFCWLDEARLYTENIAPDYVFDLIAKVRSKDFEKIHLCNIQDK